MDTMRCSSMRKARTILQRRGRCACGDRAPVGLPKSHAFGASRATVGARDCLQSFGHSHTLFRSAGLDLNDARARESVECKPRRVDTYAWQFDFAITAFGHSSALLDVLVGQFTSGCSHTKRKRSGLSFGGGSSGGRHAHFNLIGFGVVRETTSVSQSLDHFDRLRFCVVDRSDLKRKRSKSR